MDDAQRFGDFAEGYSTHRPDFPEALFDDIIRYSGLSQGASLLEVGSGTGRATSQLARRVQEIVCLEPDARMSKLQSTWPNVTILPLTLENYCRRASTPTVDILVSAQSWHWVAAERRPILAARVVRPNGSIALFWSEPPQPPTDLREAIDEIIDHTAPSPNTLLNPTYRVSGEAGQRSFEKSPLIASGFFAVSQTYDYLSEVVYTATDYACVLRTYPEYRRLTHLCRTRLEKRLDSLFDDQRFTFTFRTRLHLAKRTSLSAPDTSYK